MKKFFENPEIMINVFDFENIVTASDLTPDAAKNALIAGVIKLNGNSGPQIEKVTQIFSFNE